MKKILKKIMAFIGILQYVQVFREKFFPNEYYKNSQEESKKYIDFYSEFIKPNDLCFDVGAHYGHRTGIFLKLGAKVVAIEPQKPLFRYLKIKFGNQINLENVGLGSSIQKMTMYLSDRSALSTFSTEWLNKAHDRFADVKWNKKQEIQMSTLDKLIEKYGVPKFCKIDVEGFEFEVLKGLSNNIPYLSIEFMTPENTEIIRNCLTHLYNINNEIKINYSIGDTLKFSLEKWLSYKEAISLFNETLFRQSNCGDMYVRMNGNIDIIN